VDIGYMRCSTDKQELEAQRDRLTQAGCERIYEDEGISGAKRSRAGLDQALAAARKGDRLSVTKLDRLSRSLKDLLELAEILESRGVQLRVLEQGIDTSTPGGRLFFHLVGAFAQFERDLIRERTREGMAIARSKGKLKGGKPKLNAAQQKHLVELHNAGGHTISELAELFDVARPTVYRTLQRSGVAS